MITITLLSGLLAGLLSGLLGLGGGVILIPVMIFILGMSQHAAQGVSLLVIIPTALAGVWQLHKAQMVNYNLAMYITFGSIIGALLSANFVQYIPSEMLKRIFGVFIILIGMKTILGTLRRK